MFKSLPKIIVLNINLVSYSYSMDVEIKSTDDGSNTLYNRSLNEHYHSTFGAVQESMHVFINAGLRYIKKDNIRIFEMGFGTGLNALLTYLNSREFKSIEYLSMELFPLDIELVLGMGYQSYLNLSPEEIDTFKLIQFCPWNIQQNITPVFSLKKIKGSILETELSNKFDLIFYDAFAPATQPELWTEEIFKKIYEAMCCNSILVTYCAKGDVRRTMQHCGFVVERLPGPPGKLHMLRAEKK